MKKFLLAFMLLTGLAFGQVYQSTAFTSATSSAAINEVRAGILYHKLSINLQGTVSACTLAIDSSADGSSWTAGGILAGVTNNCLNAPQLSVPFPISAAFVRVTVTTLTGGGTANVTYSGYKDPPNPDGQNGCANAPTVINMSTATTTQIVALTAGQITHICAIQIHAAGTTTVTFVGGTGSNCGTGTANLSGPYNLTAGNVIGGSNYPELFRLPAGNAFCITNSAAVQISGYVVFGKW